MVPWFWLIAGPNGSGKSTLATDQYADLLNIDPDAIARQLRPDYPGAASFPAGRGALEAIDRAFKAGRSFSIETTLSGKIHLNLARRARRMGWSVGLAYICVEDADDAIMRVQERYRRGGHNVLPGDIRRRYRRSLQNLPLAIELSNVAVLYDNSTTGGFLRVVEVQDGTVVFCVGNLPAWVVRALGTTKLDLAGPSVAGS
jgi:predicted ABC-type ATPase